MSYWLLKSEPESFSIKTLEQLPDHITPWEGVRNYQARNFIRQMSKGDLAFFYHSSCKHPGIVGVVEVIRESYPDDTAFNPLSAYYDVKSTQECPRWYRVDVKRVKTFATMLSLQQLRLDPSLQDLILLKKGNRLSVLPITPRQWEIINDICRCRG